MELKHFCSCFVDYGMNCLMNKHPFQIIIIIVSVCCAQTLAAETLHSRYISHALQGQLSPMLGELQSPVENLTEKDRTLIKKFRSRFGPGHQTELPNTEWPFVNDIIRSYREYWIEMLLGDFTMEQKERMIIARVDSVMVKYEIERSDSLGSLEALSLEFKKFGVRALTGRTLPHFDLLAWASNEAQDYRVALTDGSIDVRVYFMSDFDPMDGLTMPLLA